LAGVEAIVRVADKRPVPTHEDYPWERDERVAGRAAARAMWESWRKQLGLGPSKLRTSASSTQRKGRPLAQRLVRVIVWGFVSILVTIAIVGAYDGRWF
jgi:hypothetical protein